MHFIDTHCHLDFLEPVGETIDRAHQFQVDTIILPGVNGDSLSKQQKIIDCYPNVFITPGIHPTEILPEDTQNQVLNADCTHIEDFLKQHHPQVVGIGECGLDFAQVLDPTLMERQIALFKTHLEWAVTYHLPVVVHNRKANEVMLKLLAQYPQVQGVFHCFVGSKQFLQQALETSFYFGIGGLVTVDFGLAEVVKRIPLERMVLETDAPYLTPKPIRDTQPWPNEPKNIPIIAQKIADLKNMSLEEVAQATTDNARQLFHIPQTR